MYIWILDDSRSDAMLIEMALEHAGFAAKVERIADGEVALHRINGGIASGRSPDLIFLDVNLPQGDALEVLRTIRRKPGFEGVKTVVASSYLAPAVRSELLRTGADLVIEKPSDLAGFRKVIEESVRGLLPGSDRNHPA